MAARVDAATWSSFIVSSYTLRKTYTWIELINLKKDPRSRANEPASELG